MEEEDDPTKVDKEPHEADAKAENVPEAKTAKLDRRLSVSTKVAKEPDETDAKAEKAPEAKTAKLDRRLKEEITLSTLQE